MTNNEFINSLDQEFRKQANSRVAKAQSAYMRNQFDFYGLTTSKRRNIQQPLFQEYNLSLTPDLKKIIRRLWKKEEREYQYCAQELIFQNTQQFTPEYINLFEFMITHKSWWDTIDFLSPKLVGTYFNLYPEKKEDQVEKWLCSNNIWLQRSCLLFQLKYKHNLNTELLTHIIYSLLNSKEFFINKAIGWILREYSKTNSRWVVDFVEKTSLSKLSSKEALKFVRKNQN